jgi:hypothetical protein
VALEKLHLLREIDCGMIQIEEKIDYLLHFYKHEPRKTLIFYEATNIIQHLSLQSFCTNAKWTSHTKSLVTKLKTQ